jgi:hypothetical protein
MLISGTYTAFKKIPNAESSADFPDIDALALERECGIARDHEQRAEA